MRYLSIIAILVFIAACGSCSSGSHNTSSGRGASNSQANSGSSRTAVPAETQTPQPTPDPVEAVRKLTGDLGTALSQGNADQLDALLSDGYVHINDLGQLVTKPDIVSGVRQGSVRFTSVNLEEVNVRVYGDAAVVTANFIGTNAANGSRSEVQDRVTLVAAREGDSWRFVSGQTTPMHSVPQRGGGSSMGTFGTGQGGNGGILGSGSGGGPGSGGGNGGTTGSGSSGQGGNPSGGASKQ